MFLMLVLLGCVHQIPYEPVSETTRLPPNFFTTRPDHCPYTEIALFYVEDFSLDKLFERVAVAPTKYGGDAVVGFDFKVKFVADPYSFQAVFTATGLVVKWHCPEGVTP